MSRTTTRVALAATAAFGLAALAFSASALPASAMSASASGTAYAPGDVVTVDGVSVTAPEAGHTTALYVDRISGASTALVVTTDAAGAVTVSTDDAAVTAPADGLASPNKCSDSAYSTTNGAKWKGTYNWRFRTGSTPNELSNKEATDALKTSVNNMTRVNNGCGLKDDVSAKNSYKGSTSKPSDVTSQPACVQKPNYQNVTEFGHMGGGGILAATCAYSTGPGGEIVTASVKINTDFEWWVKGSCHNAYGVKATMTHEYGHAFGLGHVDEAKHGNLTMSTNSNGTCSNFEASLGKGDVLGMRKLY